MPPRDNSNATASATPVIAHVQGYNQGGVFTSFTQPSKVDNTPLGIQPHGPLVRGQYVTTLKQIEAEATARKAEIVKKPHWRL